MGLKHKAYRGPQVQSNTEAQHICVLMDAHTGVLQVREPNLEEAQHQSAQRACLE